MFNSPDSIETEFTNLGKKLDALIDKAEKAAAEGKSDAQERIDVLKAKRKTVRAKLDELREGGEDNWEILKDGIAAAWKDLETTYEKMSA